MNPRNNNTLQRITGSLLSYFENAFFEKAECICVNGTFNFWRVSFSKYRLLNYQSQLPNCLVTVPFDYIIHSFVSWEYSISSCIHSRNRVGTGVAHLNHQFLRPILGLMLLSYIILQSSILIATCRNNKNLN